MKPFPQHQVGCEELIKPLKKALNQLYVMRRTSAKNVDYDGYDIHFSVGCCSPSPDEQLNKEGLKYNRERGRNPIDVILLLAFQLGYSNAAVKYSRDIDFLHEMIRGKK